MGLWARSLYALPRCGSVLTVRYVGPYPTSIKRGVSSSNHLTGQVIEIETDVPVVWTAEVRGGAE